VDCVLLPLSKAAKEKWQLLREKEEQLKKSWQENFCGEGKLCLLPVFDETNFYKTCVEIGLALDMRLGRIRRAYRRALLAVGEV